MSDSQQTRSFTTEEWTKLTNHFIGNNYRYRENIIIPRNLGPVTIKTNEEKMIESFFESCGFKSGMSCVGGNMKSDFFDKSLVRIRQCYFRSA